MLEHENREAEEHPAIVPAAGKRSTFNIQY